MLPIKWNKLAISDLVKIIRSIAEENAIAADKLGDDIESKVGMLGEYPNLGRQLEGRPMRRLVVHENYNVFYRPSKSEVRILRVKHAAQLFP